MFKCMFYYSNLSCYFYTNLIGAYLLSCAIIVLS